MDVIFRRVCAIRTCTFICAIMLISKHEFYFFLDGFKDFDRLVMFESANICDLLECTFVLSCYFITTT